MVIAILGIYEKHLKYENFVLRNLCIFNRNKSNHFNHVIASVHNTHSVFSVKVQKVEVNLVGFKNNWKRLFLKFYYHPSLSMSLRTISLYLSLSFSSSVSRFSQHTIVQLSQNYAFIFVSLERKEECEICNLHGNKFWSA